MAYMHLMFKNFKGQLNLNSILEYLQTPIENYPYSNAIFVIKGLEINE